MTAQLNAAQHTPGPWKAHPSTRYRGNIGQAWDIATSEATWDPRDYDREEGTMGTWSFPEGYIRVATTSDDGPTAFANARLIEAAPDMLEALRSVESAALEPGSSFWNPEFYGDIHTKLRAAIAKATGAERAS